MKFTYEKFPVLEKLDKGVFGIIGINPDHQEFQNPDNLIFFRDNFKANIPSFKSNIQYISTTLKHAIERARPKLMTPEMLARISSCAGTILLSDVAQYCYCINSSGDPNDDYWEYIVYVFQGGLLYAALFNTGNQRQIYTYHGYKTQQDMAYGDQILGGLLLILNFLKYAEIETVIAEPSRPIFEGVNCLYNNKSKHNIKIIDSKWITTLVHSDAFKVRGHFRLQPYGESLKERKLIWINEFQKNGYTREAKILSL